MRGLKAFVFSLLFLGVSASSASAAGLECQHLPQLFQVFLRSHYAIRQMSDEVKKHTVDQFIKILDPSKTLLLESEVEPLRKKLHTVFETAEWGNCGVLDEAAELAVKRAQEDESIVRKFLNQSYKLDESVEIVSNPDKRGFPKTKEERETLLKKMVHFQISSYLLADMKLPEAKKQLIHRYELVTKRLKERKARGRRIVNFAEAFASGLDPHSTYMSADTLEDFQIQMRLSLEGIGASLSSQDGFTVIEDLIPGGGAERSKMLRPKDKIIAVGQEGKKAVPVIDMDLQDVVKMIRGKKGTKVTLTILRQGKKSESFDVTIVRDKIDIKEQAAKITYETRKVGEKSYKIGVIELPSFYGGGGAGERSSFVDVKKLLEEARERKVDGIVLDLTRNGGGLLDEAVRISGLFIRKGAIVATKNTDAKVETLADQDESVVWPGPLVVLTSHMSASASEILAGALKDYRRAIVVGGSRTFGKGTVQVLSGLPQKLGAMKVTMGMFFLPSGASTQQLGVASDIQVPSVYNSEEVGEKTMDYSLPTQSIDSFVSSEANSPDAANKWVPVEPELLKKLAERSQERVNKNPKFADAKRELAEAASKETIKLADIRKKAKEKNQKEPESRKEREAKAKEAEAPLLQEGVNIAAEWIAARDGNSGALVVDPAPENKLVEKSAKEPVEL